MIDLFGRKRRQELFDRAYAEFMSGNYAITEKNLSQLINEGSNNFYVYNLRAQTYLALNKLHLAFRDAIKSTQLEANIEKNRDAYNIRNFITQQLKSGEIKSDFFSLRDFFSLKNTMQLYVDSLESYLKTVESREFQAAINEGYSSTEFLGSERTMVKTTNLVISAFMNLGLRFLEYKVLSYSFADQNTKREYLNEINSYVHNYYNAELAVCVFDTFFRQDAKLYFILDTPQPSRMHEIFSNYFLMEELTKFIFERKEPIVSRSIFAKGQFSNGYTFDYRKIMKEYFNFIEYEVLSNPLATGN